MAENTIESLSEYFQKEEILSILDCRLIKDLQSWFKKEQDLNLFVLLSALFASKNQGSLCLKLKGSHTFLKRFLANDNIPASVKETLSDPEKVAQLIKNLDLSLFKNPQSVPIILMKDHLYLNKFYHAEKKLITSISALSSSDLTLKETDATKRITTDDPQKNEALQRIMTSRFTLITGGPGTGKTYLIKKMIEKFLAAGVSRSGIFLAAPTGKAANRISEEVNQECQTEPFDTFTIHRLLKFQPANNRFHYNRRNHLPAEVLIVDEVSMLDVELMNSLLDAVSKRTRLVFLGDKDQLPSVNAGAVLSWLLLEYYKGEQKSITLEKNHRSADSIDLLSKILISEQQPDEEIRYQAFSKQLLELEKASLCRVHRIPEKKSGKYELQKLLTKTYREYFDIDPTGKKPEELIAHFDKFKILSVTRKGYSGSEAINQYLMNKNWQQSVYPILFTQNDYTLKLFNGDTGVIIGDTAYFKNYSCRKEFIKDQYEVCYGLTVHKSQGSQYGSVFLVLPPDDKNPLLSREILYTAITRTKNTTGVIIELFSTDTALKKAVTTRIERESGVFE